MNLIALSINFREVKKLMIQRNNVRTNHKNFDRKKQKDFNDIELSEKTKYSFWKECYNREDKIMKPKEILNFHKSINGFDEIERATGKVYKVTEVSKFIINNFENTNPLIFIKNIIFS